MVNKLIERLFQNPRFHDLVGARFIVPSFFYFLFALLFVIFISSALSTHYSVPFTVGAQLVPMHHRGFIVPSFIPFFLLTRNSKPATRNCFSSALSAQHSVVGQVLLGPDSLNPFPRSLYLFSNSCIHFLTTNFEPLTHNS
jgi:hypothetical protein